MGDIIDDILDVELEMFLELNPSNEAPCHKNCKENPRAFRVLRRAGFETWSQDTLNYYHMDLLGASISTPRRNLLFEKYGRMSGEIPKQYNNPRKDEQIDRIIEIEGGWYEEFDKNHPGMLRGNRFALKYLRGELETYSPSTIKLYLRDREKAVEEGHNLIEVVHEKVMKAIGKKN